LIPLRGRRFPFSLAFPARFPPPRLFVQRHVTFSPDTDAHFFPPTKTGEQSPRRILGVLFFSLFTPLQLFLRLLRRKLVFTPFPLGPPRMDGNPDYLFSPFSTQIDHFFTSLMIKDMKQWVLTPPGTAVSQSKTLFLPFFFPPKLLSLSSPVSLCYQIYRDSLNTGGSPPLCWILARPSPPFIGAARRSLSTLFLSFFLPELQVKFCFLISSCCWLILFSLAPETQLLLSPFSSASAFRHHTTNLFLSSPFFFFSDCVHNEGFQFATMWFCPFLLHSLTFFFFPFFPEEPAY